MGIPAHRARRRASRGRARGAPRGRRLPRPRPAPDSSMTERTHPMTALAPATLEHDVGTVDVEIVVPVFNEETDLEPSVRRLVSYLDAHFPFSAIVTIADNASTDRTWQVATELASSIAR